MKEESEELDYSQEREKKKTVGKTAMAEFRREEEEERERRDVRVRRQTADHPERTKSDHFQSSQGPLSSIKAAIKRTRTNSQSDHPRDRRRPEITIVSAEPLAGTNWFPGTPVVFSSPPPPLPQPPPSYEQVIREKTQEEHTPVPTAAPRRGNGTATSSTQTDPVKEDATATTAVPQCSAAPQSAGKKPQKPPRPSLPKSVNTKLSTGTVGPADEEGVTNTSAATTPENQDESNPRVKPPQQADSSNPCTRSVTVHWDIHTKNTEKASETAAPCSDSDLNQRPVPLPRTKSRKQAIAKEAEDDTLVKLGENSDAPSDFDPEDVSSNKYLKELLEVFSAENECEKNRDIIDQSNETTQVEDADGEMSHSQRSIRARIQAFESQAETEERYVAEPVRPEPQPRKTTTKPPVSAKPSVSVKPQLNCSTDHVYENPTPAPRPQPPPKKPVVGESVKEELDALLTKGPVPNRSRPVLTRASNIYEEVEPSPTPPVPPVKPIKEPLKTNLNINNHNSTAVIGKYENVESLSNQISIKAQSSMDRNGGFSTKPSMTRRPTTIRVPSKTGSFSDGFQDSPPPLPAQKPVGSLNPSVNQQHSTSVFPSRESSYTGPEPSLPPRRVSTVKSLPPRPPPAKPGPGRPPPPRLQGSGQPTSAPWETSPKPQAQKSHMRGPVLPPRPHPGHRLYNKYTLQLPHGIASFDYNGSNTGELSFQKNEVLVLLKEIDHNTFECQVGNTQGRVNKSRMKVITPLSSFSDVSPPQGVKAAGSDGRDSYGLKVKAFHDFDPEGPGELALRAGDIVDMVEQVDSEWYKGTCRGSTGYFPINYVKVLSDSPKAHPERKGKKPSTTVSGPRCVARFDFEGEHSDELSFSEGDVIQLKAYVGQDWARGQIDSSTGIFPLNFVEVIEDLPPPPSQQQKPPTKRALPGTAAASPAAPPEVAKPAQASQSGVEWVVALYDFTGYSEGDLSFEQGDCILVTEHINAEWSYGRLNGREGMFPRAFVESSSAPAGLQSSDVQENGAAGGTKARALFDFTSDCDEELSLQVGDIITDLESIDEEWFLGDLRGKRALVPKNYVQVI